MHEQMSHILISLFQLLIQLILWSQSFFFLQSFLLFLNWFLIINYWLSWSQVRPLSLLTFRLFPKLLFDFHEFFFQLLYFFILLFKILIHLYTRYLTNIQDLLLLFAQEIVRLSKTLAALLFSFRMQ